MYPLMQCAEIFFLKARSWDLRVLKKGHRVDGLGVECLIAAHIMYLLMQCAYIIFLNVSAWAEGVMVPLRVCGLVGDT